MPRHWTLDEANAALPEVREVMAAARAAQLAGREAQAQLEDLRNLHGATASHPEVALWQERLDEAKQGLEAAFLRFAAMGVEAKGLDLGLVDFRSRLGEQEVYLCWREGEDRVAWWHTLEGGFGGRRPVPDFEHLV